MCRAFGAFETPNFTIPFNLTGSPALALCNGYSASGLPLSLQIVGRPFEDAAVLQGRPRLRAGDAVERAAAGARRCVVDDAIGIAEKIDIRAPDAIPLRTDVVGGA